MLGIIAHAGCDAFPVPGGTSTGQEPNGTDVQISEPIQLDHETYDRAARDGVEILARSVALISPISHIRDYFFGVPDSLCPALEFGGQGSTFPLVMDYSSGCLPSALVAGRMRGTVDGTFFASASAFDFDFADVEIDGQMITGNITGSFEAVDSTHDDFAVTVDLNSSELTAIRGSAQIFIDRETNTMEIRHAQLTVDEPSDTTFILESDDALVKFGRDSTFRATAGTVTVTTAPSTSSLSISLGD